MLRQHNVTNMIFQMAEHSLIHCCRNCIGVQNSPFFIYLYIDIKSNWNLWDVRKSGTSRMLDVK